MCENYRMSSLMKNTAAAFLLVCWVVAQAATIQHEWGEEHNQQLGSHVCLSQAIDDDEVLLSKPSIAKLVIQTYAVAVPLSTQIISHQSTPYFARGPPKLSFISIA